MTAYELVSQRLANATDYQGRYTNGRLLTRCPAHPDGNPSLSVTAKPDRVLLHCWAGCTIDDILAALDLTRRDLFDSDPKPGLGSSFRDRFAF